MKLATTPSAYGTTAPAVGFFLTLRIVLSLMKGRVPTLKPGISGWLLPESYPGESFLVSFLIGLGGLRSTSPEVTRGDL